ncbi:MAG: leucine-rich repeat protein [Candidatus Caccovivens sp.]
MDFLKKHYGEQFSHLCRELFPTILEQEGLLSEVISKKFAPTRSLAEDLVDQEENFKAYIYSLVDVEKVDKTTIVNKSPEELMKEAGYILYPECKTEKDIQSFKKYYTKNEKLCTFDGGRLNTCRVWFAVKENVDEIKRDDFKNPKRQDEYGTSVISIQFTKSENSTLSIKNRYNHTVNNPDCTFGNNLDNIIEGLTGAFVQKYGINLQNTIQDFELEKYVLANDGKFYRYNFESYNIYYCENNVIVDAGEVKTFNKDKFFLIDNYIVDLENKTIKSYFSHLDSFVNSIGTIKNINVTLDKDKNKVLSIETKNGQNIVEITINKHNEIIGYSNPNVTEIGHDFLSCNTTLQFINLPNVTKIDHSFLLSNSFLRSLNLPNVTEISTDFLFYNECLQEINMPNLRKIDDSFLCYNNSLQSIYFPKLVEIGNSFMNGNDSVLTADLPNVEKIGGKFLSSNSCLKSINLPNVIDISYNFLLSNNSLKSIDLPNVKQIGTNFMYCNNALKEFHAPNLKQKDFSNFYRLKKILDTYSNKNSSNKREK